MSVTVNGSNGLTFNDGSSQTTAATGFGFKNRIINGAMMTAQRGTSFSFASGGGNYYYGADRFSTQDYTWSAGSNPTVSNDTTVYPTGFKSSYKYATGATGLTLAAGGTQFIRQPIEGYNIADCYTGNITISFWVRASTAGQYNVFLTNNTATYERYTTRNYTISSANTWEQKTITVDLSAGISSGGTWNSTTGEGLSLFFVIGANANRTGNDGLNTWATGGSPAYAVQTTGCVNLATIANSTFYITGVQLEKGSTATSFDYRPYGTELSLCQRYYLKVIGTGAYHAFAYGVGTASTTNYCNMPTPVSLRATPSVAISNVTTAIGSSGTTASSPAIFSYSANSVEFSVTGGTYLNGQFVSLQGNATSAAYVELSAEL